VSLQSAVVVLGRHAPLTRTVPYVNKYLAMLAGPGQETVSVWRPVMQLFSRKELAISEFSNELFLCILDLLPTEACCIPPEQTMKRATMIGTLGNQILHNRRVTPSFFSRSISRTSTALDNLRLNHSFEPIPYTSDIEVSPLNQEIGKIGHKKVTVVGCGQVGMAIAFSMLNQVVAGTIALVDINRDKLEAEAKDLEQGSAFHQHIRILASDEYVSIPFLNDSLTHSHGATNLRLT
jgi:hypothetical protein